MLDGYASVATKDMAVLAFTDLLLAAAGIFSSLVCMCVQIETRTGGDIMDILGAVLPSTHANWVRFVFFSSLKLRSFCSLLTE